MKSIKCQCCGKIFENETDYYQLCKDCDADYRFYERASEELYDEVRKARASDNYVSGNEILSDLSERYSKAASRYREMSRKNEYLINSTYKCKKCNANYESHYDTIFCDECKNDWNKLYGELDYLESESLYIKSCDRDAHYEKIRVLTNTNNEYSDLYNNHNKARLGL